MRWTEHVTQLTKLNRPEHLKQAYIDLTAKLREQEVNSESGRYEFLKV